MSRLHSVLANLNPRNRPGKCWTRGRYVRRLGIFLLFFMLACAGAARSAESQSAPIHTSRKYWIGKTIGEAEKEFGTPTFSEQLVETGGMLVIYAGKKDPVHFVFETNPNNVIVKAARVK